MLALFTHSLQFDLSYLYILVICNSLERPIYSVGYFTPNVTDTAMLESDELELQSYGSTLR